ncbi:MAG: acetyltransferase [Polyangiales bacterium]
MGRHSPVVVWGTSGHALVVADALIASGTALAGFIDDFQKPNDVPTFVGTPVWHSLQDALKSVLPETCFIVGVGENGTRAKIFDALVREVGAARLVTVIHPNAIVSPQACIGIGTFVGPGSVVNAVANVGNNVILNTASTVDHHCHIGDHAHLGPGVHLAGNVSIGERTLVGIGAVAIPGVKIGANVVVGAGAAIVDNVPDGTKVVGVPAKTI